MKKELLYSIDNQIIEYVREPVIDLQSEILFHKIPFPTPENTNFTFIDLFAGIGGFRIAMQNLGGKCVFTSEIDSYAQKTYEINFGDKPQGDITTIDEKNIPKHDILCAGSIAA